VGTKGQGTYYATKWFWEEGINPRDNLLNTPNGEHRRTPRHNQREDATLRPIKSPKPLLSFSPFLAKTKNWQINIPLRRTIL
jgi:hypothetical protein